MKADTNEVLAFQTWLSQSIRRAWILAFAVAIPGAFLVMWWFPHSGLALVVVAAIGIGIGVISDSIEVARNRRRQEIDEIVNAINEAVQDAVGEESKTEDKPAAVDKDSDIASQLTELRAELDRGHAASVKVLEDVAVLRSLLISALKRQATENPWPKGPLPQPESPPAKYGHEGINPLFWQQYFPVDPFKPWPPQGPQNSFLQKYGEILTNIARMTRERGVPLAGFLQYLKDIGSSPELLSQLVQKQSEETH